MTLRRNAIGGGDCLRSASGFREFSDYNGKEEGGETRVIRE